MSQLNFFMTKEEVLGILIKLFESKQFLIFEGRFFNTETPKPILNPSQLNSNQDYTIWISNNYVEVKCSSRGSGDFKGKFLFDDYYDPIIELEMCSYSNELISPGRLFFKSGWIKNKDLREMHKKMCTKVVRLFKKNLRNFYSPFKISEGVEKLLSSGLQVELGRGGMRIGKDQINGT